MKWSRRNELKVVLSVIGNTRCSPFSGRNAIKSPAALVVPLGTGAPERMKRGPIAPGKMGLIAGHKLPSFGDVNGLLPVKAVVPPLDAKNAYARAPQTVVGVPKATRALMKPACCGVMLLNVRATGLSPGITGIVADPVNP